MFEWPRKSRSTSGFTDPQGYWWLGLMDFRNFSFPTFSRSRNPFLAVSRSYYVWVTSKIQVNFRFYRSSRVLMIGSYGFSEISSFPTFSRSRNPFLAVSRSYYVWVTFENPSQLPVLQVLKGTDDWVLWILEISSFPTFSRSRNPFLAVSRS